MPRHERMRYGSDRCRKSYKGKRNKWNQFKSPSPVHSESVLESE